MTLRSPVPWVLAALSVGLVVPIAAQQQVFHASTDTVLLSVTAVDGRNHPITDLAQDDFKVFEDGVLQDVSLFARDPQPIALSLLVDSSSSMEEKLSIAEEAATEFCRRLKADDVAQIIDFNSETQIRQPFTHDAALLERAIRQIHAGGSTSLYTAIYIAIQELTRVTSATPDSIRRHAIVVLTDGEDTTSLLPFDDVLDAAKRSNVAIYTVGLRDAGVLGHNAHGFDEASFVLRSLSQATGGRAFAVDNASTLPEIYGQIADELANQYMLGYVSKNLVRNGAWRAVTVRADRAETIVRTKTGYFGPKDR